MSKYVIRHDPIREKKGLKSWGVFEEVSGDFSKGLSQHFTLQEALKAKALLEDKK
jgi:hypothetical protein